MYSSIVREFFCGLAVSLSQRGTYKFKVHIAVFGTKGF